MTMTRIRTLGVATMMLMTLSLSTSVSASASPKSSPGPEGVVIYHVKDLAPASTTLTGRPVAGMTCQTQVKEVVKYHIHTHVAIYVRGRLERLPASIGVTSPALIEKYSTGKFYDVGLYNCLYWLHTHAHDGIIHIEAPTKRAFRLSQFFDVWNQPLSASQVGPAKGGVVVFENGKRLTGDPRLTPLLAHGDIQIDVGTPVVPFKPFKYKVSGGCGQGTNSCSFPTS